MIGVFALYVADIAVKNGYKTFMTFNKCNPSIMLSMAESVFGFDCSDVGIIANGRLF